MKVLQVKNDSEADGLTQLGGLFLNDNAISNLTPLVANPGLGAGDEIRLTFNPLDTGDCADLQSLKDRGANVSHSVTCP